MSPGASSGVSPCILTDTQFHRLRELVASFCGLHLSEDARGRLARTVESRLRVGFGQDVDAYADHLEADRGATGELACLVDEITNNETYFFREEQQLEAFSEKILPELIQRQGRRHRLCLWSAGCSSGEEPLTLAMLLTQSGLWEKRLSHISVHILGTDVCRPMILKARRAHYGASSFKGLSQDRRREVKMRFFHKEGEGAVPRLELRQLVSYLHLNLLDSDGQALFGEMDAIFCRNVLMYLLAPHRQRVIQGFFRKLSPGGYLLLGHSENLLGMETPFEALRLRGTLVYRKPRRPKAGFGQGWEL